jgi:glycosyltransferase involved in cell wall biosynthesis
MPSLPVICVFGAEGVDFKSAPPIPPFELDSLDCRCYPTDEGLSEVLARDRPQAIVSVGDIANFKALTMSPFQVRRMWIHFDDLNDLEEKGQKAFMCFLVNAVQRRDETPLVTVFTPAYKTGDRMVRPFHSLLAQTYRNWEWVIVDDSDDGGETFEALSKMAERDFRVRVYKESRHSGSIGNVKRTACDLGRGEYLVELDHDDELTPEALEVVVAAYKKHPEVGFVYTDCAECQEGGEPVTYGPGWGMGYGTYRDEVRGGVPYKVSCSANINPKTIRHIVAMPNHLRTWRKSTYDKVGGHSEFMHVVDDYELMVRTFLETRMAHVPVLCYIQYRNASGNTTFDRNKEIQRLVRYVSGWYDGRIHERFVELGVDDFVWKEGQYTFWNLQDFQNPPVEPHCTVEVKP